jgi:hypothetical protein
VAGRRRRERWLTEEQREAISLALLGARLTAEVSPPGYEAIRAPLWSDFTAPRTVPEWEDFEADMNDLRNMLGPLIDHHVIWDTTGELDALLTAAGHLQHAWEVALGIETTPPNVEESASGDGTEDDPLTPIEELILWLGLRQLDRVPTSVGEAREQAVEVGLDGTLVGRLRVEGSGVGGINALSFRNPDDDEIAIVAWQLFENGPFGPVLLKADQSV